MSLLMDALRKAEEEKRRAALEKKGEAGGSEADHLASTYPPEGVAPQGATTGEHSSSNLSLEPLDGSTGDVGSQTGSNLSTTGAGSTTGPGNVTAGAAATGSQTSAFGDTTRMRLTAAQKDVFDALGVPRRNEATGTFDTLRDPESTIPSKRMLKRSLEEYFESTRSIEGSKIEVALAEQAAAQAAAAQPAPAESAPIPGASGPITAQTVFAAKRRSGSPVFSAAASLLLLAAAGLGAVGAYHWYTQSRLTRVVPSPSVAQSADSVESRADDASFEMPAVKPPEVAPVAPVETQPPGAEAPAPNEPPAMAATDPAPATTPEASATPPAAEPPVPATPPESATAEAAMPPAEPAATTAPTLTASESEPVAATPSPAPTTEPTPAATAPSASVAMIEPPSRSEIDRLQATPAERQPKSSLPAPKVSSVLEGNVMPGEIRISRSAAVTPFVPGQVQEAYEAYQRGDYNRAETLYRTALARYPENRDALLGLAALDWRRGDRAAAAAIYNRLLQSNPADAAARAGLLGLQKDRNPVADESSIKLMLQRDPESASLRAALGGIYARQQRWPEAQQSYFEAFARDKTNPDLAFNLAVSLDNLGESAAALDYYRKAVELSGKAPARFAAADVQSRIQALSAGSGSAP